MVIVVAAWFEEASVMTVAADQYEGQGFWDKRIEFTRSAVVKSTIPCPQYCKKLWEPFAWPVNLVLTCDFRVPSLVFVETACSCSREVCRTRNQKSH